MAVFSPLTVIFTAAPMGLLRMKKPVRAQPAASPHCPPSGRCGGGAGGWPDGKLAILALVCQSFSSAGLQRGGRVRDHLYTVDLGDRRKRTGENSPRAKGEVLGGAQAGHKGVRSAPLFSPAAPWRRPVPRGRRSALFPGE